MRLSVARVGRRSACVLSTTTLVAGIAALAVAAPAAASPSPPPSGQVLIEVVKANGSGCKKGTATVDISPDKEAFTIVYSNYFATVGVEAKPPDSRRNCKIDVKLTPPPGFTYTVARTDLRGYAFLEAGATAVERATYKFQGGPDRQSVAHPFAGPFDDSWYTSDLTEPGSLIYGDCGKARTLNIDTELEISAGTSDPETTSMIAMDSTDTEVNTVYRLVWKTCR